MSIEDDFRAIVDRLRSWGFTIREEPGCYGRSNGNSWAEGKPVGHINHHYVCSLNPDQGYIDALVANLTNDTVVNWFADVNGVAYLIGTRPMNHAGTGNSSVLNLTMNDVAPPSNPASASGDMSGSSHYSGTEAQHPGDSTPWPGPMLDIVVAINAAEFIQWGWTENRAINHSEWTNRKIDMSAGGGINSDGWSAAELRRRVAARMAGGGGGGAPTLPIEGVDYSWDRPDPYALVAAGKHYACRYLSDDPSKNLTRAEADAGAAAGLWWVVVWEASAGQELPDAAWSAAESVAQAQALAVPAGRPIYFAVDWDAQAGEFDAIEAFLRDFGNRLAPYVPGVYGGENVVGAMLDRGATRWAWQTYAWSNGRDGRAQLYQYSNNVQVVGANVDLNRAYTTDYGQWQPGRLPDTTTEKPPEEDDDVMQLLTIAGGDGKIYAASVAGRRFYWEDSWDALVANQKAGTYSPSVKEVDSGQMNHVRYACQSRADADPGTPIP